jgi:hypothetical protein
MVRNSSWIKTALLKMRRKKMKNNFFLSILLLLFVFTSVKVYSQQSDYEIFVEFKNDLKSLKDSFSKNYKTTKISNDKNFDNDCKTYIDKIYSDYSNKNTGSLRDLIPTIEEKFNNYSTRSEELKKNFSVKVQDFLKKWKTSANKTVIDKVGKEYDLNYDDQISSIEDIQTDIDLQTIENIERIKQFLTMIINDKVELISLRDTIDNIEKRTKTLLKESAKDKATISNLLKDNNKRKDLILKLVNMIISEHRLIPSKDMPDFKPSPFASETFNTLNSFMDDYINLSRTMQSDPDPENIKNAVNAHKEIAEKLDSLYDSFEKAKMLDKEEKTGLTEKSMLWKNEINSALDNAIVKVFSEKGVPIIFQKDNSKDWFSKSLVEFVTPFSESNNSVNNDLNKSNLNYLNFTKAWEEIKTKWYPVLIESKYINDAVKNEIDTKAGKWKDISSGNFLQKNWLLICIIALAVIILGFILVRLLKRK